MRTGSWVVVALVWCGPVCVCANAQPAKDRAPIAATFADWQTRQRAVKTARYVLSGTTEYLKPLSPDSPAVSPSDRVQPYHATVLIDLERRRLREEVTEFRPAAGGGSKRAVNTRTFDGGEVRTGQPREVAEANGGFDLIIGKKARDGEPGSPVGGVLWPILFAHGIAPTVHQPPYVERLPLFPSADDFVAHGRHTLRGAACQVFRTEPLNGKKGLSDEFWVRPDRLSAVVRYVYLSNGQPWTRLDIDWGETEVGWMPRSWSEALTTNGKDVNQLTTLKVDRFEANPSVSDADFTIPVVPGMKKVIVVEPPPEGVRVHPGHPGRRTYRITDGGDWEEVESQGWKSPDGRTDIPLPAQRGWLPWAVGGMIVLLGGWAAYRRRGRRAAPASHLSP